MGLERGPNLTYPLHVQTKFRIFVDWPRPRGEVSEVGVFEVSDERLEKVSKVTHCSVVEWFELWSGKGRWIHQPPVCWRSLIYGITVSLPWRQTLNCDQSATRSVLDVIYVSVAVQ